MTDERCAFEVVERDGPCAVCGGFTHWGKRRDGKEWSDGGHGWHIVQPRVLSVCGKPLSAIWHHGAEWADPRSHTYVPGHTCEECGGSGRGKAHSQPGRIYFDPCPSCGGRGIIAEAVKDD